MMWLLRIRRLLRATGREAMMLWYALFNPATPMVIRLGIVATGLYLFSPLDIIPDFMVLFGLADDLAVLPARHPLPGQSPAGPCAAGSRLARRQLLAGPLAAACGDCDAVSWRDANCSIHDRIVN